MPRFHATLIAPNRAEVRIAGTPYILTAERGSDGVWRGLTIENDGDPIELSDPGVGISPGALAAIERAEWERV